jgi:hypothetical protein
MAAQASQAALAGKAPEGRWASGPSVQSAKTCSTTAWSRCWASAWMSFILSFRVSRVCDLRRPVVDSVADGMLAV